MKALLRIASAIALLLSSAVAAQTDVPTVEARGTFIPPSGLAYRNDVTGKTVLVSTANPLPVIGGTGGGGGGTGDASAANQSTQITAANLTNTRLGDVSSPATGSTNQRLAAINTTLGSPFQAGGSIGNTAFGISGTLPAFAATPTFNLGTGGLGVSGSPIFTASNTPTTGTPGTAAPAYAQQVAGAGPSGNLRPLSTGTNGGLLPGQAAPVTPAPVAMAANTATSLDGARAGRIGLTIQTETAPTAIVYLCLAGQTGCSATVHDMVIPSGAGIGTLFTPLFAPTGAIYAFSTAAVTLTASSWIAQ